MTVSFLRTAESHTGTTASASVASYSFALGQAGDAPKGVVVFTMQGGTAGSTEVATAVTYGGVSLSKITGGSAADTVTELGRVTAWFLGASVPSGAQNVVVTRTNNTTISYAVGFLLNGAADLVNAVTPVLQENNGTITAVTIDPGTATSIVLAAAYSGDNTPAPAAATSMTTAGQLSGTYAYSFGSAYETTPTTGSRSRGCSQTTSDDRAHVVIAIREVLTVDVTLAEESTSSVAVVPTEVPGVTTRDVTLALESASSVTAVGSQVVTWPYYVGKSATLTWTYSTTAPTCTVPADVAVGDVLLLGVYGYSTTTQGTIDTPTDSSGVSWNLIDTGVNTAKLALFYRRVANAGEAGITITCGHTGWTEGLDVSKHGCDCVAYRGCITSGVPYDAYDIENSAAGTTQSVGAVTVDEAGRTLVIFWAEDDNYAITANPSGYTNREWAFSIDSYDAAFGVWDKADVSSDGSTTFTIATTGDSGIAFHLSLKPPSTSVTLAAGASSSVTVTGEKRDTWLGTSDFAITVGADTLYLPIDMATPSGTATRAVVVIHGVNRNVHDYFSWAKVGNYSSVHDLVIAAQFPEEVDVSTYQIPSKYLYWRNNGEGTILEQDAWPMGLASRDTPYSRAFTMSSYEVLDKIAAWIVANYSSIDTIVFTGHSSGGNMITRYALANTLPETYTSKQFLFVPMNATTHCYLDNLRPDLPSETTFVEPSAAEKAAAPLWDTYRYSIDNGISSWPYSGLSGRTQTQIRDAYKVRWTVLGQGALDNSSDTGEDSAEAELGGDTRIQRGRCYHNSKANHYGAAGVAQHFKVEVSGVAHDGQNMLADSAINLWLYEWDNRDVTLAVESVSSVAVATGITQATRDVTLTAESVSSVVAVGSITQAIRNVTLTAESVSSVAVTTGITQAIRDVTLALESVSSVQAVPTEVSGGVTRDVTLALEATSALDIFALRVSNVISVDTPSDPVPFDTNVPLTVTLDRAPSPLEDALGFLWVIAQPGGTWYAAGFLDLTEAVTEYEVNLYLDSAIIPKGEYRVIAAVMENFPRWFARGGVSYSNNFFLGLVDVTLALEATSSVVAAGQVTQAIRDVTLAAESTSSVTAVGQIVQAIRNVTLAVESTSSVAAAGSQVQAIRAVTLTLEVVSSTAVVGSVTQAIRDIILALEATSTAAVTPSQTQAIRDVTLALESVSSVTTAGQVTQATREVTLALESVSAIAVAASKTGGVDVTLALESASSVTVAASQTQAVREVTLALESVSAVAAVGSVTQATRNVTLAAESVSSVTVAASQVQATRDVTLAVEAVSAVAVTPSQTQAVREVTLALESTSYVEVAGGKQGMRDVTLALESASSVTVTTSVTQATRSVTLALESTSAVAVAASQTQATRDVTLTAESVSSVAVVASQTQAIRSVTLAVESTSAVAVAASVTQAVRNVTLAAESTSTVTVAGSATQATRDCTLAVASTSTVAVAARAVHSLTLAVESTSVVVITPTFVPAGVVIDLALESRSAVAIAPRRVANDIVLTVAAPDSGWRTSIISSTDGWQAGDPKGGWLLRNPGSSNWQAGPSQGGWSVRKPKQEA